MKEIASSDRAHSSSKKVCNVRRSSRLLHSPQSPPPPHCDPLHSSSCAAIALHSTLHICIHILTYMYICICIYVYIYIYTYVYMYICIYVYMYICNR